MLFHVDKGCSLVRLSKFRICINVNICTQQIRIFPSFLCFGSLRTGHSFFIATEALFIHLKATFHTVPSSKARKAFRTPSLTLSSLQISTTTLTALPNELHLHICESFVPDLPWPAPFDRPLCDIRLREEMISLRVMMQLSLTRRHLKTIAHDLHQKRWKEGATRPRSSWDEWRCRWEDWERRRPTNWRLEWRARFEDSTKPSRSRT